LQNIKSGAAIPGKRMKSEKIWLTIGAYSKYSLSLQGRTMCAADILEIAIKSQAVRESAKFNVSSKENLNIVSPNSMFAFLIS